MLPPQGILKSAGMCPAYHCGFDNLPFQQSRGVVFFSDNSTLKDSRSSGQSDHFGNESEVQQFQQIG
ncbi:hypothetical protein [Gimesia maris]|uniref:hypothetical protein n=1 Tax=Gimesia maris TaxID=122 RepID=UPI0001542993|nr:hypothetical protein [Gimesia maris]EDL58048.1 hypothetical protein PM8797T_15661 [Gimesia maris DSM 8797]QGQ30944.1 hypothetical protein F1729_21185 [Gimesia maris]